MWAPIFRCEERGAALVETEDVPPTALEVYHIDALALEPVDYRLLHLLFAGRAKADIAADTGRTTAEIDARITRRVFLRTQAEIEKGVVERVIKQADYEPVTIAKAAAPGAMKRVIDQSMRERDPRTRLAANQAVLKFAGVEPPRKLEITTPDRVLEQMTALELEALAERRVWPARFREVLRAFLPAPQAVLDVTPAAPVRPPPPATDVDAAEEDLPAPTIGVDEA